MAGLRTPKLAMASEGLISVQADQGCSGLHAGPPLCRSKRLGYGNDDTVVKEKYLADICLKGLSIIRLQVSKNACCSKNR